MMKILPGKLYLFNKNIVMILSITYNENRKLYEMLYFFNSKLYNFAYNKKHIEYLMLNFKELH